MDLPPLVPLSYRLATLTTPQIPPGVDDLSVRSQLLDEYNIEIAGGFGLPQDCDESFHRLVDAMVTGLEDVSR